MDDEPDLEALNTDLDPPLRRERRGAHLVDADRRALRDADVRPEPPHPGRGRRANARLARVRAATRLSPPSSIAAQLPGARGCNFGIPYPSRLRHQAYRWKTRVSVTFMPAVARMCDGTRIAFARVRRAPRAVRLRAHDRALPRVRRRPREPLGRRAARARARRPRGRDRPGRRRGRDRRAARRRRCAGSSAAGFDLAPLAATEDPGSGPPRRPSCAACARRRFPTRSRRSSPRSPRSRSRCARRRRSAGGSSGRSASSTSAPGPSPPASGSRRRSPTS